MVEVPTGGLEKEDEKQLQLQKAKQEIERILSSGEWRPGNPVFVRSSESEWNDAKSGGKTKTRYGTIVGEPSAGPRATTQEFKTIEEAINELLNSAQQDALEGRHVVIHPFAREYRSE